jgi:hypothetical protein
MYKDNPYLLQFLSAYVSKIEMDYIVTEGTKKQFAFINWCRCK